MELRPQDKVFLLKLAREAIRARLENRPLKIEPPPSPALESPAGAFVTLHKEGKLRGCIGCFQSEKPLWQVVAEMAVSSAFNDPRFPPLEKEELTQIEIEISVLSPLQPGRPEEVKVGRHGVYLVRGPFRGVLLPQVATEHGWDRETFLDHVCLKAGLPPGCWQDPETELYLFTAEIFSEKDLGLVPSSKIL